MNAPRKPAKVHDSLASRTATEVNESIPLEATEVVEDRPTDQDLAGPNRFEEVDPQRRLFGKYRTVELLGGGDGSEVYHAIHVRLRKHVAVKRYVPIDSASDVAEQRFHREARLLCELDHPNVVRFETAAIDDGTPYLVMELLEGIDLAKLVERVGPLRIPDACQIVGQAAVGLDYLHRHAVLHRDISPSNLMLCANKTVKIVDLGIARDLDSDERLTPSEHVLGNLPYIAPEYFSATRPRSDSDFAGDVYSLGCTLFALLTGHPPFDANGTRLPAIIEQKSKPIDNLTSLRADIPSPLCSLIADMTAPDPRRRTTSAGRVALRLSEFASDCNLSELFGKADSAIPTGYENSLATDTAEYLRSVESDIGTRPGAKSNGTLIASVSAVLAIAVLTAAALIASLRTPEITIAGAVDSEARFDTAEPAPQQEAENDASQTQDPRLALAGVVVDRDAFDLKVEKHNAAVNLANLEGRGTLQLPYIVPEIYSVDFSVKRVAGEGSFGIGVSAGQARMMAVIDFSPGNGFSPGIGTETPTKSTASGIYFRTPDGQPMLRSSSNRRQITADKATPFRLYVTRDRIRLFRRVDGQDANSNDEPDLVALGFWQRPSPTEFGPHQESSSDNEPYLGREECYYPGAMFLRVDHASFEIDQFQFRDAVVVAQPFRKPDATDERRLAEQIIWRGGHVDVNQDSGTASAKSLQALGSNPWLMGSITKCPAAPRLMLTGQHLAAIGRIKDVTTLELEDSGVGSADLRLLSGMRGLKTLSIGGPTFDGTALAKPLELPELANLSLLDMSMKPEDFLALGRFPKLVSICISDCEMDRNSVANLCHAVPNLRHLCLNRTQIPKESLAELAALPHLYDLRLSGFAVGDQEAAVISELPAIKTLYVAASQTSESATNLLRQHVANLQVINE